MRSCFGNVDTELVSPIENRKKPGQLLGDQELNRAT